MSNSESLSDSSTMPSQTASQLTDSLDLLREPNINLKIDEVKNLRHEWRKTERQLKTMQNDVKVLSKVLERQRETWLKRKKALHQNLDEYLDESTTD